MLGLPVKKNASWLERNWPFHHTETRLNADTGFIKIIAMAAMLIDHLGSGVFPQYRVMRIIGRIAFPLYAYCIAAGCAYTKNISKYLQRVVLLALISQPIYVVALHHTNGVMTMYKLADEPLHAVWNYYVYSWKHPSILLTLAIGIAVVWAVKERKVWIAILLLLLTFLLQQYVDYGVKGVLLILFLYLFMNAWYVSLPVVAAFLVYWGLKGSTYTLFGVHFGIQMFALLALPFIYIPMRTGLKLNKWISYCFYPAHLAVILLIQNWDKIVALISG